MSTGLDFRPDRMRGTAYGSKAALNTEGDGFEPTSMTPVNLYVVPS